MSFLIVTGFVIVVGFILFNFSGEKVIEGKVIKGDFVREFGFLIAVWVGAIFGVLIAHIKDREIVKNKEKVYRNKF